MNGFDALRSRFEEEGEPGDRGYPIRLEPGEESANWFLRRETVSGKYGPQSVYLLQDLTGAPCFMYGGTRVLDDEFAAADPQAGYQLMIRRLPNKRGPNGEYHVYRVKAQKPPPGESAPPLRDDLPNEFGF